MINLDGSNYSDLYDGGVNGAQPYGTLMQASDGKLYGGTPQSINSVGVIFQYDPTTFTYTKKIDMSFPNGNQVLGSLVQASDGKLYGLAFQGGTSQYGTIFNMTLSVTATLRKLISAHQVDIYLLVLLSRQAMANSMV